MRAANLDLTSTFVVVEHRHAAIPVAVSPTIFAELDARTSVPTTMLFVTPGEGTQNRPA